MTDWKENSIKPKTEGYYLVTILRPQMFGFGGGESYAWEMCIAHFDGKIWRTCGVLAWAELPDAYFTDDESKKTKLIENAYLNDEERDRIVEEEEKAYFQRTEEFPF